jgi:CRISPR/Cas system-associated protein Cas10 (large subunit of type III CRISPR-Cas system)
MKEEKYPKRDLDGRKIDWEECPVCGELFDYDAFVCDRGHISGECDCEHICDSCQNDLVEQENKSFIIL